MLIVFFTVLLEGWARLLRDYGLGAWLGINANVGGTQTVNEATQNAETVNTGNAVGQTLIGFYNGLLNSIEGVLVSTSAAVQMLVNIAPPGMAEDFIVMAAAVMPFIIVMDIYSYARASDL